MAAASVAEPTATEKSHSHLTTTINPLALVLGQQEKKREAWLRQIREHAPHFEAPLVKRRRECSLHWTPPGESSGGRSRASTTFEALPSPLFSPPPITPPPPSLQQQQPPILQRFLFDGFPEFIYKSFQLEPSWTVAAIRRHISNITSIPPGHFDILTSIGDCSRVLAETETPLTVIESPRLGHGRASAATSSTTQLPDKSGPATKKRRPSLAQQLLRRADAAPVKSSGPLVLSQRQFICRKRDTPLPDSAVDLSSPPAPPPPPSSPTIEQPSTPPLHISLVRSLCDFLLGHDACNVLGVFRLKGDPRRQKRLMQAIAVAVEQLSGTDTPTLDYHDCSCHDVANTLKKYLREQADSVIPAAHYDAWMQRFLLFDLAATAPASFWDAVSRMHVPCEIPADVVALGTLPADTTALLLSSLYRDAVAAEQLASTSTGVVQQRGATYLGRALTRLVFKRLHSSFVSTATTDDDTTALCAHLAFFLDQCADAGACSLTLSAFTAAVEQLAACNISLRIDPAALLAALLRHADIVAQSAQIGNLTFFPLSDVKRLLLLLVQPPDAAAAALADFKKQLREHNKHSLSRQQPNTTTTTTAAAVPLPVHTIARLARPLVDELAPLQRELLEVLLLLCSQIAANEPVNRMSAANLASMFAPSLIRQPHGSGNMILDLESIKRECRVVELLIDAAVELFGRSCPLDTPRSTVSVEPAAEPAAEPDSSVNAVVDGQASAQLRLRLLDEKIARNSQAVQRTQSEIRAVDYELAEVEKLLAKYATYTPSKPADSSARRHTTVMAPAIGELVTFFESPPPSPNVRSHRHNAPSQLRLQLVEQT